MKKRVVMALLLITGISAGSVYLGNWYLYGRSLTASELGGGFIRFAIGDQDTHTGRLYVRDLEQANTTQLTEFAGDGRPFDLLAEQGSLAYSDINHSIAEVNLSTGQTTSLVQLIPEDTITYIAWAPDGSKIAFVKNGNLYCLNLHNGQSELVDGARQGVYGGTTVRLGIANPIWTADGKGIVYDDFSAPVLLPGKLRDADAYREVRLYSEGRGATFLFAGRLARPDYFGYRAGPAQIPVRIMLAGPSNQDAAGPGQILSSSFRWEEHFLEIGDASIDIRKELRPAKVSQDSGFRATEAAAWSPDQTKIAYYYNYSEGRLRVRSPASGKEQEIIALFAPSAEQNMGLVAPSIRMSQLAWSPDGNEIAFVVADDRQITLYAVSSAGGRKTELTSIARRSATDSVVYLAWIDSLRD